jgi:hypothetical protein
MTSEQAEPGKPDARLGHDPARAATGRRSCAVSAFDAGDQKFHLPRGDVEGCPIGARTGTVEGVSEGRITR